MEEGETGDALKALAHLGAGIQPRLPSAPRWPRSAGDPDRLGCLTLREPLGLQIAVLVKQFGASDPIPSLCAISIVTLCVMDDSAHSYLLPKLMPCEKWMAQDGEVATQLQSLPVSR